MERVKEVYEKIMNSTGFVDREQAAYNFADNEAMAVVARRHGVKAVKDITAAMRKEADLLRVQAIGF